MERKSKILNIAAILTSLVGYLEWGQGQHMFLFQGELDILVKMFSNPTAVLHPFIVLPLVGQILLAITLFQKVPSRLMTFIGIGAISVLMVFMFLIGVIGFHGKTALSTLPFLITGALVIIHHRGMKQTT